MIIPGRFFFPSLFCPCFYFFYFGWLAPLFVELEIKKLKAPMLCVHLLTSLYQALKNNKNKKFKVIA